MDYITKPCIMTAENQRNLIFSLKKEFPFLGVRLEGRALCGREIFSLHIGRGDNPLLIAAGFHAQEWLTCLLALRFAEVLLRSKAYKSTVCGIDVSGIRRGAVIIPCVNPDGVEIALKGDTAAGKYMNTVREIMRCSDEKWNANARGVDINHNFDAGWSTLRAMETEAGILGPCARRYGGPMPESEPETAVLVNLTKRCRPRSAIALHSQGEEIFWEYGNKKPPESERAAKILSAASSYKLVENSSLASHGGYKDWFIEYFNRPAFTVEIGRGENPLPLSDFDGILESTLPMLTLAAII